MYDGEEGYAPSPFSVPRRQHPPPLASPLSCCSGGGCWLHIPLIHALISLSYPFCVHAFYLPHCYLGEARFPRERPLIRLRLRLIVHTCFRPHYSGDVCLPHPQAPPHLRVRLAAALHHTHAAVSPGLVRRGQ